jgi:hypothetical protein
MNRKFTGLCVLVGAAFLWMPLNGQERNAAVEIQADERASAEVELRADIDYWWPDSVVEYTSSGERTYKASYDKEAGLVTDYVWKDNQWEQGESGKTNGAYLIKNTVSFRESDQTFWMSSVGNMNYYFGYGNNHEVNLVKDDKGKLTLVELYTKGSDDIFIDRKSVV